MKRVKWAGLVGVTMILALPAAAKDIYVSKTTGSKGNDGSKAKPVKLLWKAIGAANDGDHIYVAEGFYHGQKKLGIMPKLEKNNLILEGGWSADFSKRNPFKHFTVIVGAADRQGDTHEVFFSDKATGITIDGFMIDRGAGNYYVSDGEMGANKRIPGHKDSSQWGYRDINRKKSGSDPSIELLGRGSFTVKNNIIINSPWWGISVKGGGKGDIYIENNLILSSQMRGIEAITGGGWGQPTWHIKNNTVLFTSAFGSDGRHLSIDPRPGYGKYIVEKNVLAMGDANIAAVMTKFGAKGDVLHLNDNLFYLNGKGDFGEGGGQGFNAGDFEDELEAKEDGKNVHKMPESLKKVHKPWLDRWFMNKGLNKKLFATVGELDAARKATGFDGYTPVGFPKVATYTAMGVGRATYKQGRFPHPFKEGEGFKDWAGVIGPMVGADGHRGIQPFKK